MIRPMRAWLAISLLALGCSGGDSDAAESNGSGGAPDEMDGTGGDASSGGTDTIDSDGGTGGDEPSPESGGTASGGSNDPAGGASSGGASSGGQETGGASSGGMSSGGQPSAGGSPTGGSGGGNPLVMEGSCEDDSQTVLEVPPGVCVQVWGMFELEFTPECIAFPEATCAEWDYHVEDTANPMSSSESFLIYVNRRADCGVQWEAEWHDGQCPPEP